MKSLYQCEKCNKVYEEYEECVACEESHTTYTNGFEWEDDDTFKENVMKRTVYEEGKPDPVQIAVILRREYFDKDDEIWKVQRNIGIYKLKAIMPLEDQNI